MTGELPDWTFHQLNYRDPAVLSPDPRAIVVGGSAEPDLVMAS